MKILRTAAIILAIAAIAAAVALAALVFSSQPGPVEDVELIAVGNITMTQVEGEVVAIGDSSVTVRVDGEDVEIGCLTRSALWQIDRIVVGDRVFASYHVGDDGATSLQVIDVRSEPGYVIADTIEPL